MAIPKTLKMLDGKKAQQLIDKHTKAGTGHWEGTPTYSDFVYKTPSGKYMLLRPTVSWGMGSGVCWETGTVVM